MQVLNCSVDVRINVNKQNYVLRLELLKSLESFITRARSIAACSTQALSVYLHGRQIAVLDKHLSVLWLEE